MDNSNLFSNQDIEKLKQKIESYRETLTSLKIGTSLKDYLYIKEQFDGIKNQIAHLGGITEIIDDKKNSQIEGYEEQIKLLSMQIESLNQTIGEINQDILTIFNKLLTVENNVAPTATPATNITQNYPKNTPTTDQSAITSKQPSYKMLQSLAGKAKNTQLDLNKGIPFGNEIQRNKTEERHFNPHYFQSVNTYPSQIYNGLYRNTNAESTFHFKDATNAQEIPISIYESNTLLSIKTNDLDNLEVSKVVNEQEDTIYEPISEEVYETHTQIEEINKQPELKEESQEGQKKEKGSLFFNFFRRWN